MLDRIDETNSTVNVPTKTDNKTTTVIENIGEKTNTQTATTQQQQQAHTDTVTGKEETTYKHSNSNKHRHVCNEPYFPKARGFGVTGVISSYVVQT